MPVKEFVLTHVFKNVSKLENGGGWCSHNEEHCGVEWSMQMSRKDDYCGLFLHCESSQKAGKWSIETDFDLKFIGYVSGKKLIHSFKLCYDESEEGYGSKNFIKWKDMMKDYAVDDIITARIRVKIIKVTGIEKKKLRNFDEAMMHFSDVVLVVGDEKFFVSKLFLATQSSYFEALFAGKFMESKMKEIKLKHIDPKDFQNFLEVLYGDPAIDDNTVIGILNLADMYDAQSAIRRCEEFLMEKSDKTLKEKLKLSTSYKLKNLQNNCFLKINTINDIKSVLPGDIDELDQLTAKVLLQKLLALH